MSLQGIDADRLLREGRLNPLEPSQALYIKAELAKLAISEPDEAERLTALYDKRTAEFEQVETPVEQPVVTEEVVEENTEEETPVEEVVEKPKRKRKTSTSVTPEL